ncbi:MAG: AAA family ATPase [Deltaproteobacteria bacterium]|nr:AAA family ATPase [Deltaproteobacteria bacterium]
MYMHFYGFSEEPFRVTPDPAFLYLTPSHREALAAMARGIQQREGFIGITGEVGTGKTTLVHALLRSLGGEVQTVFLFHPLLTFEDLLRSILLELEFPSTGEPPLVQFRRCLEERRTRGEILAVIIDEAQVLDLEVMRGLEMIRQGDGGKVLQIVLVGQPELEAKLAELGWGGLKRRIRPLHGEECREYIDHRLHLVGSRLSRIFTVQAVEEIACASGGIPRVINILCDNALLVGYSNSAGKIDQGVVRGLLRDSRRPQPRSASIASRRRLRSGKIHFGIWRMLLGLLALSGLGVGAWFYWGYSGAEMAGQGTVAALPSPGASAETLSKPLKMIPPAEDPPAPASIPVQPSLPTPIPVPDPLPSGESSMPEIRIVQVKEGWTFFSLIQWYYPVFHPTLVDHILEVNPHITNINLIWIDQEIRLPRITEESLLMAAPDRTYKIHLGTFAYPQTARSYRSEPALKGKEVEIIARRVSPRETWYRVVVGKFRTRGEGLQFIRVLKKKGLLPPIAGPAQGAGSVDHN